MNYVIIVLLPTTLMPLMTCALAESPSVRIKMQFSQPFFPALLASSNLGIPKSKQIFSRRNILISYLIQKLYIKRDSVIYPVKNYTLYGT